MNIKLQFPQNSLINTHRVKTFLVINLLILITACSSQPEIEYPAALNHSQTPINSNSNIIIAKSASDFKDKDIVVPANFEPQGLDNCNFTKNNESDDCPLKKPIIRVYFDGNNNQMNDNSSHKSEAQVLQQLNNNKLGLIFENQLAGLNRFRIVTSDNLIQEELKQQMSELSAKELAEKLQNSQPLQPDYILKLDTLKTAERFYAEYNGMAQYSIELTASVIDPFTKEKLAHPNLGKIRVEGTDVKPKQELVYSDVSGKFYTGFDYTNADNVNSVFNQMASKAFDVLISRLLIEVPAMAQVQAFRNNQITLDRGRNAGLLDQDTLVLFKYHSGFIDPIAVATVTPSSESAIAKIVRWKNNKIANEIKNKAKNNVYKSSDPIFAISVGLPKSYLKTHM